jgi:hypothetical protein
MTSNSIPISIRQRRPAGLSALDWDNPPNEGELIIDRMSVSVRGLVRLQDAHHPDWIARIEGRAGVDGPDFLRLHHARHNSHRFGFDTRLVTIAGSLAIHRRPSASGEYGVTLDLSLNPTRTLAHLGCPHDLAPLRAMRPDDFFRATNDSVFLGLDRGDNVLRSVPVDARAFAAWNTAWLNLFEQKLRAFTEYVLFPPPETMGTSEPLYPGLAGSLNWEGAALRQVEVYLERQTPTAVAQARTIGERLLAHASRPANLDLFAGTRRSYGGLARRGIAVQARMESAEGRSYAIYAKTLNRVRFESRVFDGPNTTEYRAINRAVENELSPGPLMARLHIMKQSALLQHRQMWASLRTSFSAEPPVDFAGELATLAELLRQACTEEASRFEGLLALLLHEGGINRDTPPHLASQSVLDHLVAAQVLQRYRPARREPASTTRYALSPRFLSLRAALGFGEDAAIDRWQSGASDPPSTAD